jgi:hypothetical protein
MNHQENPRARGLYRRDSRRKKIVAPPPKLMAQKGAHKNPAGYCLVYSAFVHQLVNNNHIVMIRVIKTLLAYALTERPAIGYILARKTTFPST